MAGGGGGGSEYDVHLNLVPLIDILCNILFFLMMSFAATEMKYEGDLKLPSAPSEADDHPTISVTVTDKEILVDKLKVAEIRRGKIVAEREGDKVVPLYESLNRIREERQGQAPGKNDDVVYLFADKTAPYTLLSPVMKTAASAGFPNFKFAVVKK